MIGPDSTLAFLRRGDSITVTGRVQEATSFGQRVTTRLADIQPPIIVHSSANPVPLPVDKTTGTFGPAAGNGDPNAEPYEGMLVRFTHVTVTDIYPYFSDPTQYEISDGTGGVWVHRDGTNTFTNVPADSVDSRWHVLRVGDTLSTVTGVIHFSVNRYKFVPRSNADFPTITGVANRGKEIPVSFALAQNYPNPFNPNTMIQYDIPASSLVILKVFSILGQEVATLVNEQQHPGRYTVRFDGMKLASGVYFYRLIAGNFVNTKKMLFLK